MERTNVLKRSQRNLTSIIRSSAQRRFSVNSERLLVTAKCSTTVATLLWPSVGVKPNTPKVGDLESSGTPERLGFDSKAQNTSHWGILGVIGKVLKRRYRKWPRIGHLDICNPSYGQKKGRESNCQFDFRPLKVGNKPLPDLRIESARCRWKDLDEGYNFGSDLVAIRFCNRELWAPKVPGLQPGQFRDSNLGVPGKSAIRVQVRRSGTEYIIGRMVVTPPESRPWCVLWSKVPMACPNTQGCSRMWTNHFVVCFGCRFKLDLLVPLPSLIPGLLARPSTPL
jgi:hypothetical protein